MEVRFAGWFAATLHCGPAISDSEHELRDSSVKHVAGHNALLRSLRCEPMCVQRGEAEQSSYRSLQPVHQRLE